MMSKKQIKERIYKLQDEIKILKSVLDTANDGTFGRPKGSLKYTDEQIKFLNDNRNTPMQELVIAFNNQFGTIYPPETRALYNFMSRTGILTPEPIDHNQNHFKDSPPIS